MLPLALVTMVALDDRARTGTYHLRYVFGLEKSRFCVSVETAIPHGPEDELTYQSITPAFPAANWYEREAHDLFGLIPLDHPDPRHLMLPRHCPGAGRPLSRVVPLTARPPFCPLMAIFRHI